MDALRRISRIERDVGRAGFQHGQQSDDEVWRAVEADRDERFGSSASGDEEVSELVGALVE